VIERRKAADGKDCLDGAMNGRTPEVGVLEARNNGTQGKLKIVGRLMLE